MVIVPLVCAARGAVHAALRLPGARLWTATAIIWATASDPNSYTVALATTLGIAGARGGDWSELIDACLFAEILKYNIGSAGGGAG